MQYIKIPVFGLHELDGAVQERVVNHWRDGDEFFWGNDWRGTLNAFTKRFSGFAILGKWQVEAWGPSYINVRYNDSIEVYGWQTPLTGVRLWKWLRSYHGITHTEALGHCELTGMFCDDGIMEPLYKFMARPDNHSCLEDLLAACFDAWVRGYQTDYEYWLSEESVCEDITEHGIVFYQNGEVYSWDPLPPTWHSAMWRRCRNNYYRLCLKLRRWHQASSS